MTLPRGADFKPAWLLRSGHLQTMLSSSGVRRLFQGRKARTVREGAETVTLALADGVRLHGAFTAYRGDGPRRGLAVLYHGWEGSIDSTYVLQTGSRLLADGWDVFRLNFRDHGETHHLNVGLFHSCLLDEVVEATAEAACRYRREGDAVVLCGFSLGGNFALRVALQAPKVGLPLAHALAVCPVIDPHAGLFSLEAAPWIYEWYFMHKWRGSLRRKQVAHPGRPYFEEPELRRGLRGLTQALIERHTDFGSLEAYLDGYSVGGDRLAELRVPATILTAEDDPVIPVADFRSLELPANVDLDIAPYGGHCGFLRNFRFRSFLDDYIALRMNAAADAAHGR